MRLPKANNSSQHPDFTSFDSLHTGGLFTLSSGEGVCGLPASSWEDQTAGQGRNPNISWDQTLAPVCPFHSVPFPVQACSSVFALPQLLLNPFHLLIFLLSQGLILPPLTFPLDVLGCRTTCRKQGTSPAPQSSAASLPLYARQGSLGSASPGFSAMQDKLLLAPSSAHSLQSSSGMAGRGLRWWHCQRPIHGVSVLRLPIHAGCGAVTSKHQAV